MPKFNLKRLLQSLTLLDLVITHSVVIYSLNCYLFDDTIYGIGVVRFISKHNDESIELRVNCQDDVDIESAAEETDVPLSLLESPSSSTATSSTSLVSTSSTSNEDSEDTDAAALAGDKEELELFGVAFSVTVTKRETPEQGMIVFNCVAGDRLRIRNVRHFPRHTLDIGRSFNFSGPVFSDMESSVQTSFLDYLAERKIDNDLSYFVLTYCNDKDSREYLHWLRGISNFISDEK